MLCHVYEFEVWTWRTWLYNTFELSNFWKEIKLQLTNHKQTFWHCFSNFLFVNSIVLGYSSLNISSTIWDLKLKRMSKYKQVWTLRSYIFAPCIWLAQNYMRIWFRNVRSAKLKWKGCMRIWFRNVSSAKLKWKGCTRRIKHDCLFLYYGWLKLDISFSTSLLTHFSSCFFFFFANYCHLLSFFKNITKW